MTQEKIVKLNQKQSPQTNLSPIDEMTLKITKEIVIKFIEMGRCSPATFEEIFPKVFEIIKKTVTKSSN